MHDDFDDTLDDIIGGAPRAARKPEFKTRLERAEEKQQFVERCPACGGSGRWRGFRACFKCKGTGKLTFRTDAATRAKGRMRAEEKRELKAELDAQWQKDHVEELAWLARAANINQQRGGTFDFPQKLLEAIAQFGTLTDRQLGAVHKCMLRDAERAADREQRQMRRNHPVEAGKIEAAFATAKARAQRPGAEGIWLRPLKLRAQDVDLTFTPGSEGSQWAGMIFVRQGDTKLGHIQAGVFKPRFECSDATKAAVIEACEDPAKAAVAFGKAWSICSVCNRTLTNDESIARGIGPICADNMGF